MPGSALHRQALLNAARRQRVADPAPATHTQRHRPCNAMSCPVMPQRTAGCSGAGRMRAERAPHHTAAARPVGPQRQRVVITRALDASKLLKRPELKRPEPPKRLFDEQQQQQEQPQQAQQAQPAQQQHQQPQQAAQEHAVAAGTAAPAVTVEWQRARAKEMLKYFKDQKLEAAVVQSRVFGWTPKNEITNGRWVMFGVFVGLLTEYATGVDFPHQLGLLLSYLGIVDVE